MKKITRATLKSFINKNRDQLLVKVESDFDGMVDCVMPSRDATFTPAVSDDRDYAFENTLGIRGLWLVGQSRDGFQPFEDDQLVGIKYYNCCGSGVIAIKK